MKRAAGSTLEDIRRIALSFDNVVEVSWHGTAGFKVSGKLFVREHQDRVSLVVGTTFEEREALMSEDPETYYITDHYQNYPYVLVGISRVHPDALRDLMTRARNLASKQPASKPRPRQRTD
jgi:hypothetical protein